MLRIRVTATNGCGLSPQWQQWANPFLMMICTVSGFAFALHFLAIKIAWPRVYRVIIVSCSGFSALILLAMLIDEFVIALLISIGFIFFFYIASVILGAISLRADNKFAKYFLLASIFSICGGTITANAVWGFIPFNWFTYRATDIGMMADAILLARHSPSVLTSIRARSWRLKEWPELIY